MTIIFKLLIFKPSADVVSCMLYFFGCLFFATVMCNSETLNRHSLSPGWNSIQTIFDHVNNASGV